MDFAKTILYSNKHYSEFCCHTDINSEQKNISTVSRKYVKFMENWEYV